MKGWIKILLFILPYFIVVGIFQLIGFHFSELDYTDLNQSKTIGEHLIVSLFSLLGTLLTVSLFMKFIDKESFFKINFTRENNKNILVGAFFGFILITISLIVLIISDEIIIKRSNFIDFKILQLFLLCLIIALTEELLLRGYILKNLIQSFNNYIALLVSSLLFSIMHLANPNISFVGFINIFIAGILLGLCYIKTKKLWLVVGLHFSWNFFQSIYGFNVSGQKLYSLFEIKVVEDNLFNGGSFGIEGSIIASILQIGLILYVYFKIPRSTNSPNFEN